MKWNEKYSVNVQSMDIQHKKLFELLDELLSAMKEGKGSVALSSVLDGLTTYTIYHFKSEENLISMHGYPELEAHKLEHKNLIDNVSEFKKKFDSGQIGMSLNVMNFLNSWITDHILQNDKEYGKYLNSKGIS